MSAFYVNEVTGEAVGSSSEPSRMGPWRKFDFDSTEAKKYAKSIKQRYNAQKNSEKEAKQAKRSAKSKSGEHLHGLYCVLVGWWLALVLICIIVPLFFRGGRLLIKKAFGIW
jgi:hypothetical protein